MAPLSIRFNGVLTATVHGNYTGVNENHVDMERQATILMQAHGFCSFRYPWGK